MSYHRILPRSSKGSSWIAGTLASTRSGWGFHKRKAMWVELPRPQKIQVKIARCYGRLFWFWVGSPLTCLSLFRPWFHLIPSGTLIFRWETNNNWQPGLIQIVQPRDSWPSTPLVGFLHRRCHHLGCCSSTFVVRDLGAPGLKNLEIDLVTQELAGEVLGIFVGCSTRIFIIYCTENP